MRAFDLFPPPRPQSGEQSSLCPPTPLSSGTLLRACERRAQFQRQPSHCIPTSLGNCGSRFQRHPSHRPAPVRAAPTSLGNQRRSPTHCRRPQSRQKRVTPKNATIGSRTCGQGLADLGGAGVACVACRHGAEFLSLRSASAWPAEPQKAHPVSRRERTSWFCARARRKHFFPALSWCSNFP